ncbi:MAG: hypothetical protein M3367_03160 [Acidobacteriota bacterium]|nr:hypothetical protein [Acidobacteriota bacterium]
MHKLKTSLFLVIASLIIALSASQASATEITISSLVFPNTNLNWGTSPRLRIVANNSFVSNTGVQVLGNSGTNTFYKEIKCTPNVAQATLTCPAFTIQSTTNSSVPSATFTASFYDSYRRFKQHYLVNFAVPTSLGTTVTWAQLINYNAAPQPALPNTYYTTTQTDAQISAAISAAGTGTGIPSINGLTGAQTISTGTTGTNFSVFSSGSVHELRLPNASATATGRLLSSDWSIFNNKAPTASPTLTGVPTAPTAATGTNTTQIATTAFVLANGGGGGGSGITSINGLSGGSQTLTAGATGTDFAISSSGTSHSFLLPAASGSVTGKLLSTDWTVFNNKAATASPALTGVPTAPNAPNGTNTTQIATTAFVLANGGGGGGSTVETIVATEAALTQAITDANNDATNVYSVKASQSITLTSSKTIPADIILSFANTAKFVEGATAVTITFQGVGLENPLQEKAVFIDFEEGDITWTGTKYPSKISTGLFDNAALNSSASYRMNMADRAFLTKKVEILATVGNLSEQVTINNGHSLTFAAGTFTNNYAVLDTPNFLIGSDSWVRGQGMGVTTIMESSTAATGGWEFDSIFWGINVIYRNSAAGVNEDLKRAQNITLSDMTIQGVNESSLNHPASQEESTVFLGTVENGRIERIHFRRVHGFAAYFGNSGFTSNALPLHAKNCFIIDNIFEDVGTQQAGAISVDGMILARNLFIYTGFHQLSSGYGTFIDFEPNDIGGLIQNIRISDNVFNGIRNDAVGGTRRALTGIAIQSLAPAYNITIENNQITGSMLPDGEAAITQGILMKNVIGGVVKNNTVTGTWQAALNLSNSSLITVENNTFTQNGHRQNALPAVYLSGIKDSTFRNNTFAKRKEIEPINVFTENYMNTALSDSTEIKELDMQENVTVTTTGTAGNYVSKFTLVNSSTNMDATWVGRYVSIGSGTGVNAGVYKIASVTPYEDIQWQATTLTGVMSTATFVPTVNAGNTATGATVTMRTKFSNNRYINNTNANYRIFADSKSFVNDTSNAQPVHFFNAFVPTINQLETLGDLNANQKTYYTILSIETRSRVAPACSVYPVIRITANGGYFFTADNSNIVNLDVTLDAANKIVKGNVFSAFLNDPLEVKVITAGTCTTFPTNVNVAVGYQTGVRVNRETAIP